LENKPDSTFCAGCGKRLHVYCPACGIKIVEEACYCDKCGHDFHVSPLSLLQEEEQAKDERHKEHYVPRVRSARIASVLHDLLALKEESKASDIRRDHLEHSLTSAFEDPWLSMHDDGDVSGFLHDYWQAIRELWPEAFGDSNEYCLRDMLGFSILNKVFPDVIRLCRKAGDFSKETMRQVLARTGVGSDFWHESNLMRGKDPESCVSAAVKLLGAKLRSTSGLVSH
jgi:hypothetical protein